MDFTKKLRNCIIGEEQATKGIVIECNNNASFAVVKYICHNNKFYPNLLLVEDYETFLDSPIATRIKKLNKLIGTSNFKIREFAFEKLFSEVSEYDLDFEFEDF